MKKIDRIPKEPINYSARYYGILGDDGVVQVKEFVSITSIIPTRKLKTIKELKVMLDSIIHSHLKKFQSESGVDTEGIYKEIRKELDRKIDEMFKIFNRKKLLGVF